MQLSFHVLDKLFFKLITDVVFIQVSLASESASAIGEQLRIYVDLMNETSRQV